MVLYSFVSHRISIMRRKGAKEARNQLPALLDAAEKGQSTIVTKYGRRPSKITAAKEIRSNRHPERRVEIMEKATFGAGCFWGVEETFRNLKGVVSTSVGYAGGTQENPTYHDVCTDKSGHAEVVEIEFDPSQVSYDKLLDVFWSNHNPTTLNRQGPDVGTQYRSVIFYHSPEQRSAAAASKEKVEKSGRFNRPIVTQIESASKFWRAEEYHQRYLQKRGQSHCAI